MPKKKYAKEVFSTDLMRFVDRTKQPHPLGKFDIDVGSGEKWAYFTTKKTEKAAEKVVDKYSEGQFAGRNFRIVDAETGAVLKSKMRKVS